MKKILALSILFFSLGAYAQTDTTGQVDSTTMVADSIDVKIIALPDSTAIGAPDGKPASKEIGLAGGTLISDDGKVELVFPEGALTETRIISIQPITNLIPNGNGKAYQFEPSGIQFMKPVELIFHYTQEEIEICPPDLRFLATQSSNGKWEYMEYENWDSTNNSFKAFISHFSAYVDGMEVELDPLKKTLKVGQSFGLTLTVAVPPGEEEISLLPGTFPGKQIRWSVEGPGKISRGASRFVAQYTAPKYLPDSATKIVLTIDTSFITTVVQRSRRSKGWRGTTMIPTRINLAKFICNVKLYDEYKITTVKKGKSILECGAELDDRSSFTVRLAPGKIELDDIVNAPPTLTKQAACKSGFSLKYDNSDSQGPVHFRIGRLIGVGSSRDDNKAGRLGITPPEIRIEFAPGYVTIMNSKGKYPGEIQEFIKVEQDVTVGNKIRFKANRTHQDLQGDECQLIIDPL